MFALGPVSSQPSIQVEPINVGFRTGCTREFFQVYASHQLQHFGLAVAAHLERIFAGGEAGPGHFRCSLLAVLFGHTDSVPV